VERSAAVAVKREQANYARLWLPLAQYSSEFARLELELFSLPSEFYAK